MQQAIQQDPKRAIAYEMLGLSQFELRQYAQAAASFKQAIALNSQRAKPYYRLGETLMAQNQVNDGIRVFYNAAQIEPDTTASVKLDPNFAKAYKRLGDVLADQKKFKEAEAALRKAIQLNPRLAAYTRLRFVLRAQGKFDDAFQVPLAEQVVTK